MSQALYEKHLQCEQDIGYTWDWGEHRTGSWVHDNQDTSINRYLLDFDAREQQKTLTMAACEPFALPG